MAVDTRPSATRALAGIAAVVVGVAAVLGTILATWTLSYVAADHATAKADYVVGAGVLLAALGLWVSSVLLWRHARRI